MTPFVACLACARPIDALLTGGLHAGVAVMAVVALVVIGGLVRGVVAVARTDADEARHDAPAEAPR